jgi:hypothetical protein
VTASHTPQDVVVVVAPQSFDSSSTSGTITGPIWLRHDGYDERRAGFPEPGWSDFPVVVLGWWLTALGALRSGAATQATCLFMDGPFEITVTDAGGPLWRVQCVRRNADSEGVFADLVTSRDSLLGSITAAAEAALAECDRRRWSGRDVEALRRAVRSARPL